MLSVLMQAEYSAKVRNTKTQHKCSGKMILLSPYSSQEKILSNRNLINIFVVEAYPVR